MAFMMPVMKNNYDIYKDTRSRSRKTSECSNASSSNGTTTLASALGTPAPATGSGSAGQQQQRRRKVSECKSESFATSPTHGQLGPHRMQMQRCHSSRGFTRNTSRSSHGSMMQMNQMMSPTRSSPPSRTQTASALERQAAAQAAAQSAAAEASATTATIQQHRAEQSNNDYTKFHTRLVEKLRKSFRKDNGKRSSSGHSNNNNNNTDSDANASIQQQLQSPSQSHRPGVVSRLGRRFKRCCQAFGAAAIAAAAAGATAPELNFNDIDGSGGSAEQLTTSSPYVMRRCRRRCSSGSSLNRLKLRLRRTTSSPG
ncbi:hypothetical protein ACLKA6_009924 [Drosophila palustris]